MACSWILPLTLPHVDSGDPQVGICASSSYRMYLMGGYLCQLFIDPTISGSNAASSLEIMIIKIIINSLFNVGVPNSSRLINSNHFFDIILSTKKTE